MRSKASIPIFIAVFFIIVFLFFRFTGFGEGFLQSFNGGDGLILPVVVAAALVDSVNPCAFSVLLLTIAFLFSMGKMRSGVLKIGSIYIAGLFVVYVLIGLGIIHTLYLFNTPNFAAKVGALILILFGGISIIGEVFPKFPIKLKIPERSHHKIAVLMERASGPAAFGLGVLVGLFEFPCTGGPYLAVLGLLHDKASYLKGFAYLILYNFIFVLPLVIILFVAVNRPLLEKVERWQKRSRHSMRFWGGIIMMLLGFVIFLI